MAVLETVKAFYRGPTPPFPRLAGPISLTSQRRSFELSQAQEGEIVVALEDVEPAWVRAGNCWSIESEMGEDLWAGFVDEEEWELDADSVRIPLLGPLRGLLEVEVFVSISSNIAAGSVVQTILESAQAAGAAGIQLGRLDPGPSLDLQFGGETAADAIITVKENTDLDFRERAVERGDGGIDFFLDFANLLNPTSIILTRREIIAGLFTRGRFPVGLTVLGPGASFAERESVTVSGSDRSASTQRSIPTVSTAFFELAEADVGPAATKHASQVDDRLGVGSLPVSAEQRYFDILQGVQEIMVTLDGTLSGQPKLGDSVGVRVQRWAGAFNVDVHDAHIHAIEPHEEDGSRDLVLGLHPHG